MKGFTLALFIPSQTLKAQWKLQRQRLQLRGPRGPPAGHPGGSSGSNPVHSGQPRKVNQSFIVLFSFIIYFNLYFIFVIFYLYHKSFI